MMFTGVKLEEKPDLFVLGGCRTGNIGADSDMKIDVMVTPWMRGEDYIEQRYFCGLSEATPPFKSLINSA